METWRHVQQFAAVSVGISLILFFGMSSCMHSSSLSSEADRSNPDFDSNNSDVSSFCSCKRFIMESYYENNESLSESDFQDFAAQAFPMGLCGMLSEKLPRLSVLHRNLIGEGSHRHLSSYIRLNVHPKSLMELPIDSCEVIIIERLPSGVFADPFELQHLLQLRVFNDMAVFGDTNLELPSFLSNRSVVEVHRDVDPNFLLSQQNVLNINIVLPLHARYPSLDESGYSRVEFGPPNLFLRCRIEGGSHSQSCLVNVANDGAELQSPEVVWRIPSGRKAHAGMVSFITFISALVSTILIVVTCIVYSEAKPYTSLKQS